VGVQPRCSGLRVQGTASSPPSTAIVEYSMRRTGSTNRAALRRVALPCHTSFAPAGGRGSGSARVSLRLLVKVRIEDADFSNAIDGQIVFFRGATNGVRIRAVIDAEGLGLIFG